jgi:tetratricopeptide (TPR) repeat protein
LATAAASLLVLLGVGGWLAWQPRCALASVAGIWDAPRRSAAREALGKAGLPYVKDLASRIDEAMARHLADWSQAHDAICAAPRLRGMDPPAQARLRCLDAQLVQVRAFADLFAEADAGVVENAARALEALPTARACVGRTPSLSGPTQPRNADEERLLRETARLQAELAAGRFEKVASEAEGLLVEARRRGAPSLESELLLIRGTALVESGHAEASQVLQEAAVVAGNAQRDDLAARALLKLGFNAAINTRSLVEGRKWTARAKDIIDRLGDQGVLRAGLDSVDGVLLALEDKPDEALVALQSALDRYAQVLGPDHRQVGGAENNLGLALFKLGRWEEAKPHFERAAAIQEATLGPSHPGLAKILHGLATAHRHLGEYDRAIEQSNRSLQILTDAHRENTPLAAQLRSGLGRVLLDKGEAAQALREQDAARELFEKLAGPTHSDLGVIEEERGRALLALGRWADALSAAERSLGIAEKRWGEKDPRLAYPLAEIGLAHLGLGEPERALAPLERALDISATARAPDEARPAARLALARALWALDREPERALELARQAQQELAKGNAAARRDALVAGALVADHESPPGSTKK